VANKKMIAEVMGILGRRGGRSRAQALSKAERSAIAKKAAEARWKKRKQAEKKKSD